MENSDKIKELAELMGVSPTDVKCLAESVCNSLELDGTAEAFVTSDSEARKSLTEAYVVHAVKKYNSFQNKYMTNPEARDAFNQSVVALK